MAIGLSRMFNVKLPLNFNSPYKAPNIIEFWRRWHMTLSAFLRDYLYVPIGGSRKGVPRRYGNLMITMLLGGLWHGAGWTFVLWGGLHGVYLVINHAWRHLTGAESESSSWRAVVSVGLTFVVVVIAWVPFRAADTDAALRIWAGMFGVNSVSLPPSLESRSSAWVASQISFDGLAPLAGLNGYETVFSLWFGLIVIWLLPNTQQWMERYHPVLNPSRMPSKWTWRFSTGPAVFGGFLFALCLLALTRESAFLYFQF